jgi:hypothetical protein
MRLMKLQTYSTIKNRRDHHLAVFHQDEKPASPVLGCPGVSGKGVWEAVWDLQDSKSKHDKTAHYKRNTQSNANRADT